MTEASSSAEVMSARRPSTGAMISSSVPPSITAGGRIGGNAGWLDPPRAASNECRRTSVLTHRVLPTTSRRL